MINDKNFNVHFSIILFSICLFGICFLRFLSNSSVFQRQSEHPILTTGVWEFLSGEEDSTKREGFTLVKRMQCIIFISSYICLRFFRYDRCFDIIYYQCLMEIYRKYCYYIVKILYFHRIGDYCNQLYTHDSSVRSY